MELKNKKIIVVSFVFLLIALFLLGYGFFEKAKECPVFFRKTSVESKEQANEKLGELRDKFNFKQEAHVIEEAQKELADLSNKEFDDKEKYEGMLKIYLAFAYAFENNQIETMKNLKEVVESPKYHKDQRALAAQEIANRLATFDINKAEKYLFQNGLIKDTYVVNDLHGTEKNLYELSVHFRPTPLSYYALSNYYYERAASLKIADPAISEEMATMGAERLWKASILAKTMNTNEWVYDRRVRSQLFRARIYEKMNRFDLRSGNNKTFSNDNIDFIYRDILRTEPGSRMIGLMMLTKLYYAIFLNNSYGYNKKQNEIENLINQIKKNVESGNSSPGFIAFLQKEKIYQNDYYTKKDIINLAKNSKGLEMVLKSVGWEEKDLMN